MAESWKDDLRLIEAGFPCHQVGAETQRERGASSALPPLYYLHVWWARRPLTPSRAAVLASLLPADTDPDWFLRQLGIEKKVVEINGVEWTLTGKLLDRVQMLDDGQEVLEIDQTVLGWLDKENKDRFNNQKVVEDLRLKNSHLANNSILGRWQEESKPIPEPWPEIGERLKVDKRAADPSWFKELMNISGGLGIRVPNLYGYDRAYKNDPIPSSGKYTVLDPTSGGGSIPFESLRLGHNVIANELNPVAAVILNSTLDYPARFGTSLLSHLEHWGQILFDSLNNKLEDLFPAKHILPNSEMHVLKEVLHKCPEVVPQFNTEDTTTYLYCRQVTCPNCHGEAPLLNTCWLSKEDGKQWGVKIIPNGRQQNGKVRFETYRATKGKGPAGEDPGFASVTRAVGTCVHCRQAISAEEIKSQARGESDLDRWKDRLYCVVAVRFQPRLDKNGQPLRYKSGAKKGEIKTEKIRFFRPPNEQDLAAIKEAENRLKENWDRWEDQGLIPTEAFPQGNDMRPVNYGMPRWCDMFTPRQLLGHLYLMEELNRLKPEIIDKLGQDKGRAVITYLQFAIDKGLDYNTALSTWETTRSIVKHIFARHDFSLKWTFGEMIFSGPHSGFAWCLSQIYDAYKGMAQLMPETAASPQLTINCGTAAHMPFVPDNSVDLVCMDPPYYNNVQYAELSDYFYVWQKRTLGDLYPDYFKRRLTDKQNEAVANPDRDGGTKPAHKAYEQFMADIFRECHRVLKPEAIMTLMFTHKSQDAWEALTKSLISSGWTITATVPVDSESSHSMHLMEKAGAASSIFISCRKRTEESHEPALWSGFGGSGVQQRIQQAVEDGLKEFQVLKLNPVDEMVASYGRALRVLSEQWPVIDGEEEVGPIRAMNEASRVVSENQIQRLTNGRLKVSDLSPEASMALTLFGIFRLGEIPFDEVLNISKSLNIAIESKTGGYNPDGRFIGYNSQAGNVSRKRSSKQSETGYHAPLVRKGSKLRLAAPEERHPRRLEFPQSEWDILYGVIMAYREGDIPVARAYLDNHAADKQQLILDLLDVWAAEIPDESLQKEAQGIIFGLK
ncbi:DUF1156 domain-containing protein [Desulfonatronovibrio magnus]|uniref:DUF1156 domain-containing protein n=1 Tax=Desulfonatronovibrio magnus TaxID=698827 RepID=UPI0005EB84CD|nr:DUF1156 domain-containing protein [Desulfonatronovibrio magnus]